MPSRPVLSLLLLLSAVLCRAQTTAVEGPLKTPSPRPVTFSAADSRKLMDNDAVIRMSKAGISDDLILETMDGQRGNYATDADAIVALKQAGVSERVISRMVQKSTSPGTTTEGRPISLAEVNEIGVYYKDRQGKWQPLQQERLRFQSGGFLKSTISQGIIKQDNNGRIEGRQSTLTLTKPVEILVYMPDGITPQEYELVRLRQNSKSREFRESTGGVFHSSTGAQRDEMSFAPRKTGLRTFQFTLGNEVKIGEFGVLPPGVAGMKNAASTSKIYTFAISE